LHELNVSPCALQTSNPFVCHMLISRCLCLNQYHQLLHGIPLHNGVAFVYVIFVIFIFSYYKLINNSHSCIVDVHIIISALSFFVSTPPSPIFEDLVFPFRWSTREFMGMFHDMLALLKEFIPFSLHLFLLVFYGTWFSYGANLLLYGQEHGEDFPC